VLAYYCNAEEFTEVLVKSCSRKYPDLTEAAHENLRQWRLRNLSRVKQVKEECRAMVHPNEASMSAAEIEAARKEWADFVESTRHHFSVKAADEGNDTCINMLKHIATDELK
jgi:hypothetical protein